MNPLNPPVLGDLKESWGTPPDPWQRGKAPLHSLKGPVSGAGRPRVFGRGALVAEVSEIP